jgi:transcriptional regulator with XRE-family HTH domain
MSALAESGTARVGELLRGWRERRRLSQLSLALDAGVSTRHLSCVETGRAKPSAELLLALAEQLGLPLRERNRLLLAAGFAPRFSETQLGAPGLQGVRGALQRLLDAHHPYPGVALDRHWNVVLANAAAKALVAQLPAFLQGPPLNVFRASLHPEGMAAWTLNFADWGRYLIDELQRVAASSTDAATLALAAEVMAWPNVAALAREPREQGAPEDAPALLIPCVLELGGVRLSLFTTLATFGSPRDVTLAELTVELFYPADAVTEAALRAMG